MISRQEGLTDTYNRFHSPTDLAEGTRELRRLHQVMDVEVAKLYGWSDMALDHGFYPIRQGIRFTISDSARLEVLCRLTELNRQMYQKETEQGLCEGVATFSKGARRSADKSGGAGLLLEEMQPMDD